MSIYVDIQKKFHNFMLSSRFTCGDETLALLGASGCGKSVTLQCIAGIIKPDSGRIVVNDEVFFDSEQKINLTPQQRRVGYLFQHYALFPNMTVHENIKIGAKRNQFRNSSNSADAELIDEIIEKFKIDTILHQYPSQISGGQKQRVALARIMVSKPSILLLDEPFSALDSHLRFNLEREMMASIGEFEKTVIMVSHDRDEVFRMSDSIAIMNGGKIEQVGKKHDVFSRPRTKNSAILTGCKNISDVEVLSNDNATFKNRNVHKLYVKQWGIHLIMNDEFIDRDMDKHTTETRDVTAIGIRMHDVKLLTNTELNNNFDKYFIGDANSSVSNISNDNLNEKLVRSEQNTNLGNNICNNVTDDKADEKFISNNMFKCHIVEKIENPFSYTVMVTVDGADMISPIGANVSKDELDKLYKASLDNELRMILPEKLIIRLYGR